MTIEEDFWTELAQIKAESIGWIPLEEGAYLHIGSDAPFIQVVGIAKEDMASSNVLWLLWVGNGFQLIKFHSFLPQTISY